MTGRRAFRKDITVAVEKVCVDLKKKKNAQRDWVVYLLHKRGAHRVTFFFSYALCADNRPARGKRKRRIDGERVEKKKKRKNTPPLFTQ